MALLIIASGKQKGRQITVPEREVIIGRDEGCFIRLPSGDVSRRHCLLKATSRGILVRDLKSQNGTLVNGAPIKTDTLLKHGDLLQVGPLHFQVSTHPAEKKKSEPDLDEDIASWLTGTESDAPGMSDTTIVKSTMAGLSPTEVMPPGSAGTSASGSSAAPSPPGQAPRQHFASLAEEARDIIRRHFEQQAQKKPGTQNEPEK